MDRTDYQILNLLQNDCRATLKVIGEQVGLTAPAVSERIRRMEEAGVIRNFRIDVDRRQLDCNITGFILVAPEPDKYERFCRFCEKTPAILSHSHTIGIFNAVLRFAVRDTQELDAILSSIKRYGNSQTSVELGLYFDSAPRLNAFLCHSPTFLIYGMSRMPFAYGSSIIPFWIRTSRRSLRCHRCRSFPQRAPWADRAWS